MISAGGRKFWKFGNFMKLFFLLCVTKVMIHDPSMLMKFIHTFIQSVPWQADVEVCDDFYIVTFSRVQLFNKKDKTLTLPDCVFLCIKSIFHSTCEIVLLRRMSILF